MVNHKYKIIMQVVYKKDFIYFNFYEMQKEIAKNGNKKLESIEEIQEAVRLASDCTVVGYITAEKGREWKIRGYVEENIEIYVVSFRSCGHCYCLPCGMVVNFYSKF